MKPAVSPLHRILNPQCVAVVGASGDPAKFGGRVMQFLVEHRYAGRIVPVNPHAKEVFGVRAYPGISRAAGPIDVALLAVPARQLPAALEECGAAHVPCCVIITSDFAELGAEGAARQDELVRIARRHGTRLIGPNCLGFINPHMNLALTSSVALAAGPMPRGAIGLVSQSGSLMASLISHAQDLGTGFSACVSVGNQADLEICDFVEHFLMDPATRAICLYVEGLRDGARFLDLADRCRAEGKPLLAVKAGRSDAGMRIAQSHTASLAGSYAVWEAACRDRAICVLDDPECMIQCADFLVRFGAPRGEGVAAFSPSGGTIAVTSDRIVAAGLQLAQFSPETRESLGKIFPVGRPLNPLDIGGLPREQSMGRAAEVQELIASDPHVGAILIVVATTPQLNEKVRHWGAAALRLGKPTMVLLTPGSLVDGARAALREIGCPFTNRLDDALRVLRAAIGYGRALRVERGALIPPAFVAAVSAHAAAQTTGRLTEFEAKRLLRTTGVATTADIIARDIDAAVSAAHGIGYPVVLKAACRELVHKSDIGAVKLNLADPAALKRAWNEIRDAVAQAVPRVPFDGCVVQPMASGGIEMIVGTKWDPHFGATVLVGAGGVLVEILQDVQLALAPVSPDQALALIRNLRSWPLLDGARGHSRADISRFADAVVRVSWIAAALGPRLSELDVNPLLVKSDGQGVIALDARATLAAQTH